MRTYSLTNPLQHGDDLKPLQTALHTTKLYGGPIDGVFGVGTADACKRAKYRLGYPIKAVERTGGQTLLDYLNGSKPLPLAYRLRRHARGYGISREDRLRQKIVAAARRGVADEPQIHYAQIRPMPASWYLPMTTDCSGFVTLCYRVAGAKDPNGLAFNGEGYTGTLLDHGESIPLWQAKPGDLVVWGSFPGHHVAVIADIANPADPQLVSHGSEKGPIFVSLLVETAAQRRPYVVKRYAL
jgi:hypothetical protein